MVDVNIRWLYGVMLSLILGLASGCIQEPDPLVVYAGKGLKHAVDEIKQNFEQLEGIPVSVVYAGSETLLTTIRKTGKGDVFIPGSPGYIKEAGELVIDDHIVALHVPTFVVSAAAADRLHTYTDLLEPGVRIAIGNSHMNAIGRIAESIDKNAPPQQRFSSNIVVMASTVNELLELVADGEVDAAMIWKDMMQWPIAQGLMQVEVPKEINKPKEVRVATLSSSLDGKRAALFADYVATEGSKIFLKHGFGQ